MTPEVILVPLDGTREAAVALPVASGLANLYGATLEVLHVARRELPPRELLDMLGLEAQRLHGWVLEERLGEPGPGILRVAAERPWATIVMCTHTGRPARADVFGPIAEQVLLETHNPIVLVRPERALVPWEPGAVLLPHDGTPTSAAAIRPAALVARAAEARLSVLYVAEPGARSPVEPGSISVPRYLDQRQHEWPRWMAEFVERLAGVSHFDVTKLHLHLGHGEPGREVVRFAAENGVDLIVLAWRGALEEERAQVVKSVLHDTPCPVMVLRADLPKP